MAIMADCNQRSMCFKADTSIDGRSMKLREHVLDSTKARLPYK